MQDPVLDIVAALQADYSRFPHDQTYDLYAEDVYFKDPLNEFRGRDRYRRTIQFIERWFIDPVMEVHQIQRQGQQIRTDWTLRWIAPTPWKPHMAITGWSDLTLNEQDRIIAHIDYWHCSRLDVVKQLIPRG